MILTQKALCEWLRSQGLRISPSTIHHCIEAGMPVVRIPWITKPRFDRDAVWTWLLSNRQDNALALAVRDRITRKVRRAG